MVRELERSVISGGFMVTAIFAGLVSDGWLIRFGTMSHSPLVVIVAACALVPLLIAVGGFFVVNPNEAQVLQLFGHYAGTVKSAGLKWANPFYSKKRVSQRAVSFESGHLKVNDLDGNPIEIAAIVVWKVVETAKASFDVDDFARYVQVQTEAALRNLATSYPYDSHDDANLSLRGHTAAIAEHLKKEVQEKVELAGVQILDARISHLAYAPEIAQAMLQRQQAGAIIAARTKIVEGAVGMVEMASSTRSARLRWCPTSWWSCAASARRSR